MRTVRWHGRRDVRVEEVECPRPSPGEVLVRVELCGICGTDVEMFRDGTVADVLQPLTLGHEVVGVVAAHGPGAGPGVPPVGTRVIPDVVLGCGDCWWCRRHQEGICERQIVRGLDIDGGLAGYMLADARTCAVVPQTLPPRVAVLAEPTAVAVRALRKAGDLTGGTALVYGAGTIGVLVTQVAVAAGIRVIVVELAEERREIARRCGALPVAPEESMEEIAALTDGRGADAVFECTGVPAVLPEAVRHCRRGGTVVVVGFGSHDATLPVADLVLGEKRLVGTAAHLWDEEVTTAVRLLDAGVVDTTVIPMRVASLDQLPGLLAAPDPAVLKVAVRPRDSDREEV